MIFAYLILNHRTRCFFLSFEVLFDRLRKLSILNDMKDFQCELQQFAQKSFNDLKSRWLPFLRKDDYELLKQLSLNENLVVT